MKQTPLGAAMDSKVTRPPEQMSVPLTILKSPLLKINLEPDVNTLAPGPRGLHLP